MPIALFEEDAYLASFSPIEQTARRSLASLFREHATEFYILNPHLRHKCLKDMEGGLCSILRGFKPEMQAQIRDQFMHVLGEHFDILSMTRNYALRWYTDERFYQMELVDNVMYRREMGLELPEDLMAGNHRFLDHFTRRDAVVDTLVHMGVETFTEPLLTTAIRKEYHTKKEYIEETASFWQDRGKYLIFSSRGNKQGQALAEQIGELRGIIEAAYYRRLGIFEADRFFGS